MAIFDILTVSSGSSIVEYTTTGSGMPRLHEGGDASIYIYSWSSQLLVSKDGAFSFDNIIPSGVAVVNAICQRGTVQDTIIFYMVNSTSGSTKSQPSATESASGWATGGPLVVNFRPSDAIGDDIVGRGAALVGNTHIGTEARVLRSPLSTYTSWTQSHDGLPTGSTNTSSRITDLERPD